MSFQHHNWSGWPGAWCLDCGCDDPREAALADGNYTEDADGWPVVNVTREQMECKDPGSGRFDPYKERLALTRPERSPQGERRRTPLYADTSTKCDHPRKLGGGSVREDGSWSSYWTCQDCGASDSQGSASAVTSTNGGGT